MELQQKYNSILVVTGLKSIHAYFSKIMNTQKRLKIFREAQLHCAAP